MQEVLRTVVALVPSEDVLYQRKLKNTLERREEDGTLFSDV